MHFNRLAEELGASEDKNKRLKLIGVVTGMEQDKGSSARPLLKCASPVELDHKIVYPIYRTDQEAEMIEDGRLAGEVETNLGQFISEETLRKFLDSDF